MKPAEFSRTTRCLRDDGRRRRLAAAVCLIPLGAWLAWFVFASVTVFKVSADARVEADRQAHWVAPLVEGRVVETRLGMGRKVKQGEPLVILDSRAEELATAEKRSHRDALQARGAAIRAEIASETTALVADRAAVAAALQEAESLLEEAKPRVQLASQVFAKADQLLAVHAVSLEEHQTKKAESDAKRAALETLRLARIRLEHDGAVRDGDRQARIAKLAREVVELEGDIAGDELAIEQLQHQIELHTIRAPVDGVVGEAAEIPIGSIVQTADKLGAIVPQGPRKVVAMFPVEAAGRIRPRQKAQLRLTGFVWTQYGVVPATVAHVANEPCERGLRVELLVDERANLAVPLEHGMPCSAEVEVERISPSMLVLRAAGQLLAAKQRESRSR